jgi:hypothetical protein
MLLKVPLVCYNTLLEVDRFKKMVFCCGFDVWICGTASLKLIVVLSLVCRYVDLSIKL